MLFILSDTESKFIGAFLCICNRYKKSVTSSDYPSSGDESSDGDELDFLPSRQDELSNGDE